MPTNIHDLPQPLVEALTPERRRPVPGRFGVTTLIDSPLRRILTMRHFDEITEDVSENIWVLLGKMGHKILEINKQVSEIRIEHPFNDATIAGVIDYTAGEVIDFKFTSVWSYIFASDKSAWEQQLQIYGYLVQSLGQPVTGLANWLILRDWNKREAAKSENYPKIPFAKIEYKLWDKMTVEAFIQERVSLHLNAEKSRPDQASNEIPTHLWCTPTERWKKEDKWAVMKKGQVRAVRLYDSEEAAEAHFDLGIPPAFYIEHRPGEDTRCENYCSLNVWCPYYTGGLV